MLSSESKSFQERLAAVGILKDAFAALAGVHPSDVSRHSKGYHVAPARVERMDAALVELEELVAADDLKLNLSDVANIRAALARLTEKRAESNAATILAEDSKPRWARAVAIAPANPELLTEPLANKV